MTYRSITIIKSLAKSNPLLVRANALIKSNLLRLHLQSLRIYYSFQAYKLKLRYDERQTALIARCNIFSPLDTIKSPNAQFKHIFWVGSNFDQDMSGLSQALERMSSVTYYYNQYDEYGLNYKDKKGLITNFDQEVRRINGDLLVQQVKKAHAIRSVDLLAGQMWANYISKESLLQIKEMGIPIINVSMDDRLPTNWTKKNGLRLGAVGLASATDLILTTTPGVCGWYQVEGTPSIYLPLASDPTVFLGDPYSQERDIDLLFIGNRYGIRSELVKYLSSKNISVSCWGGGWANGYATISQSAELCRRSKIILGIGTVGYCRDIFTLKLRDFDAPMSGAMYLTHNNPDLKKLYKVGEEIICYSSFRECYQLCSYYLSNAEERKSVAKAGQLRAFRDHTWDARIAEAFEKLLQ